MFYTGQRVTGGLPTGLGNEGGVFAKSNPLTDPKFKIPGGQPWNKTPLLPGKDTKEFEGAPLGTPFQLPGASNSIGNVGGLLAQMAPNMRQASVLGGPMNLNARPEGFDVPQPNVFSVRPRINYMDPEQGGLELGGAVNVPIGQRGRINVQGGYQPDTSQLNINATVGQPQGAPGFGVDFFMNRKLRQPSSSPSMDDYGAGIRYGAQF